MALPVYIVGNTHRFRVTAKKDGAVWDLTSATVTLVLVDSAGNVFTYPCTLESAVGGIAYADVTVGTTAATDDEYWERYWKVVDGGITMEYGPIPFTILPKKG